MPPILELHGVSKVFRVPAVRRRTVREHVFGFLTPVPYRSLRVLDGVDVRVTPGETVGIMGRNGSGKSTLLKIMSGIYPPDTGTVTARGLITPILELGIGWNPELDAVDNICVIGVVMGMSRRQVREATDSILAFAGLEAFANMKLHHYSSGMASRLAYAVAFHAVRDVLILDEVFAVGDAEFRGRCEERYRELHRAGHSVVLVSHDPRAIATFCQRAMLLENGRICAEADGDAIAGAYLKLMTDTTRP
jgi:ABC-type polysaccharide/polyol phosphate transport system ATPase subunit